MRREIETSLAALRQDQHAASARLQRIDDALGGAAALIDAPVCERLTQLESELIASVKESADLESALNSGLRRLNADLHELAARPVSNLDASLRARLDDLNERLSAQEQEGAAAAANALSLEQCLETLGKHIAESAAESGAGLAKLEASVAELARHAAEAENAITAGDLQSMAAGLEQRLELKLEEKFEQALAQRMETLERATSQQLENERRAFTDLVSEARAAFAAAAKTDDLDALAQRLGDFEAAQTHQSDALSGELTRLTSTLDQRLHSVEQFCDSTPADKVSEEITQLHAAYDSRLNDFEHRDGDAAQGAIDQVEQMRQRFEERLALLERRSVQAIERISETVAALTQRAARPPEDEYVLDLVEQVDPSDPRLAQKR
jgi:uncharacterized phage infection (PIP) family protein YhgE